MRLVLLGLPLFFLSLTAISWGMRKFKELPFFKIGEVVVEGNIEVDFSELIGKNIFDVDSRELRAKYENEKVKLVKVRRLFPGQVMVEVEKRKPFAILELGETYEIDSEGFILGKTGTEGPAGRIPGAERKDLPVIRIFSVSKDPTERNTTEVWEMKSKEIMDIIHLFMGSLGGVKEIRLCDDDLVIETDFGGKEIHLGQDQWMGRIKKLTHIDWRRSVGRVIDLRFKNQIIVRRR